MNSSKRPILYYLFQDGKDFKVVGMTDVEANELLKKGTRWLDIPKSTQAEAEELRLAYMKEATNKSS
jgi:hypothetical protein